MSLPEEMNGILICFYKELLLQRTVLILIATVKNSIMLVLNDVKIGIPGYRGINASFDVYPVLQPVIITMDCSNTANNIA